MLKEIQKYIFLHRLINSSWINKELICGLVSREIGGRYQGTYLGLLWAIINPLIILSVYTFVFSVVFKARWNSTLSESKLDFAIVMFVGVIIHGTFAESVTKAPLLVLNNPNYVKKIVFPLEILPIVNALSSLFHGFVSFLVLLFVFFLANGFVNWTFIFFPLVFVPLFLFCIGFGLILSSLGVFLRDISQGIGIFTTALLFLSPVFYPVSTLPIEYQYWMMMNPLTLIIEQSREIIIWGHLPDWLALLKSTCVSVLLCWVGYFWFQKTRKGFADVI